MRISVTKPKPVCLHVGGYGSLPDGVKFRKLADSNPGWEVREVAHAGQPVPIWIRSVGKAVDQLPTGSAIVAHSLGAWLVLKALQDRRRADLTLVLTCPVCNLVGVELPLSSDLNEAQRQAEKHGLKNYPRPSVKKLFVITGSKDGIVTNDLVNRTFPYGDRIEIDDGHEMHSHKMILEIVK